jgi:hypothetical protein
VRTRFRDIRDGLVVGDAHERGVVLAFLAMILFTLIVMAGLAVDVGNWWWTGQKVQRTADAAAMAGVTYLPADLTTAQSTANDIANRNGYENGTNATIVAGLDDRPTELRVTITTEVDNFFTGILGFKKTTITRSAVADYVGSVPMGSPADYLGQDPEVAGRLDNIWLSIASPNTDKANGDRYHAYTCATSTYGCGTGTPKNNEYLLDSAGTANGGYRYVVEVESITAGQPLAFQIYDPAHVNTGLTCGSNMPSGTEANNLQAAYSNHATYGTFFNDAGSRYSPTRNQFCTGDDALYATGANSPGDVAYIVRAPDQTPWNDLDNPIVSGCVKNFRPINTSLYKYLNPTDPAFSWGADPATNDAAYVREVLHRWVTICTVPSGSVATGEYIIQVRTNHDPSDPEDYLIDTTHGGASRFSIRAGFQLTSTSVPGGSNIQVHANGKLPLYVNGSPGTTSTFYLARIMPSAAGRTLQLDFYDIGDIGTGAAAVAVQVVPPSEYAATFSDCIFKRDNASAVTSSTCSLTGLNSTNYQARLVTVSVPIPADYTCSSGTDTGCWVKVNLSFNLSASPTDVTTWTARVDGDPIRLVE